jgi:hypothetical protein
MDEKTLLVTLGAGAFVALTIASLALGEIVLAHLTPLQHSNEPPQARVSLILPATGQLRGLERLLDLLADQTLPPRRLIVCVESREDPAFHRVGDLIPLYPSLHIELVVAGASGERAQKCTNLLAGFSRIEPDDAFIVTFDADILPPPWWLAELVGPLANGRADIVSGYRWQVPQRLSPATVLGAAVDRAIAAKHRPEWIWAHSIWGGSIALTAQALRAVDMPGTLAHALTEDLAIDDKGLALGLRILTPAGLRLPTPLDLGLVGLWRFARRQYQIVRGYRRLLWWCALAVTTADLTARAILLGVAAAGTGAPQWLALAALLAVALIGSASIALRCAFGRRLGARDPTALVAAFHALAWAILPLAAFHAAVIWASALYSPVDWAHVRYTVDNRGRVLRAARRRPEPGGKAAIC